VVLESGTKLFERAASSEKKVSKFQGFKGNFDFRMKNSELQAETNL
jgi:hypothetical protein